MFLVVPFVALCAFAGCLLAAIALKIRIVLRTRAGATPSPRLVWWYRSLGQLTLVSFALFVVTRLYYFF